MFSPPHKLPLDLHSPPGKRGYAVEEFRGRTLRKILRRCAHEGPTVGAVCQASGIRDDARKSLVP
jgi:hypothetical protein